MIKWDHNQEAIFKAVCEGKDNLQIIAVAGSGKCLGKGTPILLFSGEILPVEQIKEGFLLMGPDSTPRTVLSTTIGTGGLFKVTPTKGEPWICNDAHLISVVISSIRKGGSLFEIPAAHIEKAPWRKALKLVRTAVEFGGHSVLEPYFAGVWLGDGDTSSPRITTIDSEIVEACRELARDWNYTLTISPDSRNEKVLRVGFAWKHTEKRHFFWWLVDRLKDTDGNKTIPFEYLTANRSDRLELLAGLLDTDGSLGRGCFDWISKHEHMQQQMLFLCRSLGFAAHPATKIVNGKPYYRVSISGDTHNIPCRIKRKQAEKRKQIKEVTRTGFKIEPLGDGEYFGFTLDKDGRFLLGDFTITHNTTTGVEALTRAAVPRTLALAFNKKIQLTLQERLPKSIVTKTMNALGHAAVGKGFNIRPSIDTDKVFKIARDVVKNGDLGEVLALVRAAKSNGLVPSNVQGSFISMLPDTRDSWLDLADYFDIEVGESSIEEAREILNRSIRQCRNGILDFDDQIYMSCQPKGNKIAVRPSSGQGYFFKDISEIVVGDKVVSFDRRTSKFIGMYNHGSPVTNVCTRMYSGLLLTIEAGDKSTTATGEHKWLVRFIPGIQRKSVFFTYLMYKEGSFKLGQTQCRSVRPDSSDGLGLAVRCAGEGAELAWILGVHYDLKSALNEEALLVARFGITDKSFKSEMGEAVHAAQKEFPDLVERARNCLRLFLRDVRFPFWRPNCTRSFNSNFILESYNLLPEIMEIPSFEGDTNPRWKEISLTKKVIKDITVYSIEVARHELYISNGLLTHNSLFGMPFEQFDLVFIDEAQDLSPIQHKMLQRVVSPSGRLIAVGDPHQGIYGFRGAAANSMDLLGKIFSTTNLPLSISYRCPQTVVAEAKKIVPFIEASPLAPKGSVNSLGAWSINDLISPCTVICRNNAPLMDLAYKFLSAGKGVAFLGRDIGAGLSKLIEKISKDPLPIDTFLKKLGFWEASEVSRKPNKEGVIRDKANCLRSLSKLAKDTKTLSNIVGDLFRRDSAPVILTSIHKAKGLEWSRVYLLDEWRIPSKYAQREWQIAQEMNCLYVAITRSQSELIYIDSRKMIDKK